eukprot:4918781-Pyramimonas_sp.AAC.1
MRLGIHIGLRRLGDQRDAFKVEPGPQWHQLGGQSHNALRDRQAPIEPCDIARVGLRVPGE